MQLENQQPLLGGTRIKGKYRAIIHYNSNRMRRSHRYKPFEILQSIQVIRSHDGAPLPHRSTAPPRSRYTPHVGKKQLAKLAQ